VELSKPFEVTIAAKRKACTSVKGQGRGDGFSRASRIGHVIGPPER
jgi:hypothetical protein